ncbi:MULTISPECIES: protein-methionine-sulfoxide reductase heme-binding subunit MsrQ [Paraburkholderia]|uniref:Protein-methionine-sulfoxide reductase heme-binding subunit MsrQ n=1 Tax=Paraburkholderia aspalathi TaxID=1324617 RepID=A0A1I7EKN2_9BURK|nr:MULTISPECIES: protein-methionine-sulfoxide reductase heme-binding subunit MsrQ [Paraburkholderia]MCX4174301.1 protein-methionine-sulfoxide reductase heme-binding subunit MsrQ [Paraburkholderia madseniana]MDQ6462304.1 protein-methionine-sulfoxide reductase heme-binding subunit MsrQ [Paraburkholderia madseniana]SFU24449.1 sulfoxide reductase heme-binding subunit YedZ [Paraburkholderia aspalathi]
MASSDTQPVAETSRTTPRTKAPASATTKRPATGARWIVPAKIVVFIAAWYPLARIVLFGVTDRLGANPIEFITRSTGLWTLVFLCITLAVTPLRRLTGITAMARFRRMLGLYAFFYATLHFTTYLWFDKWFDVAAILKDIGKRPFITVGFAAFVLLIALAVTSPRAMVRKLGRRWQTLHRAIYAIGGLAILHFWWMKAGKHDLILPKIYGAIMVALLGWRLLVWLRERRVKTR